MFTGSHGDAASSGSPPEAPRYLPELREPWGCPLVLAGMAATYRRLYRFIKRRGWP